TGGYRLQGTQTLIGMGGNFSVSGTMTAASGSTILPGGPAAFGTLNVGALTLNAGSILKYKFGAGQDLISASGGLNVASAGFDLFQADGTTQLSTTGTYTVITYGGSFSGATELLQVLNPSPSFSYAFNASSGSLMLTVSALNQIWNGGSGGPNF